MEFSVLNHAELEFGKANAYSLRELARKRSQTKEPISLLTVLDRPPEIDLRVDDRRIKSGDKIKLSWEARFAHSVEIRDKNGKIIVNRDGFALVQDGQKRLTLTSSNTYTARAYSEDRRSASDSVTVTVESNSPKPKPQPKPKPKVLNALVLLKRKLVPGGFTYTENVNQLALVSSLGIGAPVATVNRIDSVTNLTQALIVLEHLDERGKLTRTLLPSSASTKAFNGRRAFGLWSAGIVRLNNPRGKFPANVALKFRLIE